MRGRAAWMSPRLTGIGLRAPGLESVDFMVSDDTRRVAASGGVPHRDLTKPPEARCPSCGSPPQVGMAGGAHLVESFHRRGVRCGLDDVRIVLRLAGNRQHGIGKLIKRALALRLRGLDHDGLFHDEREVDRGRVEGVVEYAFGHVARRYVVLPLLACCRLLAL